MYNLPFRDERSGSYSNWPTPVSTAPGTGTSRPTSRIWLEISDDEDGPIPNQPQTYKPPGSKSEIQVTPPLDLSGNTKKTRQPESPLDLSVKTRKRHADTTDEAELRAGHLHDGLVSKRMCLNQMDFLQGRRYSQEEKLAHLSHGQNVQEKQMLNDSMLINRVMQNHPTDKKYAIAQRRNTPMTQTNPLTVAQQQSQSLQRHSQMSAQHNRVAATQSMYPPGFDSQQQRSQHQTPPHLHPHPHPQTHSQPQSHPILQNKPGPYDSLSSPLNRSVLSSSTESVALQGFFEPTCKVTVNPGSSAQPVSAYQSRMSNKGHSEQSMMPRSSPSAFPMGRSREMPSPVEQRTQQMLLQGMGFPASSPGSRVGRLEMSGRGPQSSSELELMQQQKQSEHHRHVQQLQRAQRGDHVTDKMAYVSQISQQKGMMADRSRMIELMKQAETVSSQMHHQNKSLMSPYSQKLHATYAQSVGHSSSRLDEAGLSSGRYIRASQPITLADINKKQGTPDQPQVIQNQQNMYGMSSPVESGRYSGYRHGGPMASTAENLERARHMQSERERRYHIADNAARSLHQADRLDPLAQAAAYTHPSVIQRPVDFIPPRIVSGSGRPSFERSTSQHVDKITDSSLPRATSIERYGEKRDSLTVDNPFSDGTQIMKSQGLSSHKLGYFDNKMKPRPIHQDTIRTRAGEILHPSTVEYNRESTKEQMMMSRVKQDMRDIRRREQMTATSTKAQGVNRYDPNDQKSRAYMSQIRDRPKQSKLIPMSQPSPSAPTHVQQSQNRSLQRQASSHEPSHTQSQAHSKDKTSSSNSTAAERSITKGTSGVGKAGQGLDLFSQIVMNELQKKTDDSTVNPFKNVSLLREYDKSANASPIKFDSIIEKTHEELSMSEETNRTIPNSKESEFKDPLPSPATSSCQQDNQSYTLPLQIAIPGNKPSVSPSRTSVISSAKLESSSMKTPKMMSRKHMILSAFKNDEDRKNSVSVSQDDKSATVETPRSKRPERERDPSCPPSPKMPILSPQDRGRPAPLVSPAIGEPPKLEDPSASNANTVPNTNLNASSAPTKPMLSLEEQLHKLISAAVKGSVNKDKESVYETVRRELNTQPQAPKVFLSRQTSQTRNIPVANVAPIVHGKVITEPGEDEKIHDQKCVTDMDEEDEKMAQLVTMSLLGKTFEKKIESVKNENIDGLIKNESQALLKDCIGECSNSSANFSNFACESNFDENSNSKRMSPGLKKLMLYRHRDLGETSKDGDASGNDVKPEVVSEVTKCLDSEKEARNVFGAFSEILAQKSEGEEDESTCWPGLHHEDVEHQIHMVPNTDYDGDDEEYKQSQKVRRCRQSNAKQQADRLVKKAKHRRNSEVGGLLRSCHLGRRRRRAGHRGPAHRGFVDFQPQVLPRRTRSRLSGKSPTRRKSKANKSESTIARTTRRKSSQESKTRQRRASSLDRETKAKQTKAKTKQKCFSDNELDHTETSEQKPLDDPDPVQDQCKTDAFWHHNDESTDEEYFQNYEDEFKKLAKDKTTEIKLKKPAGPKKRKGFHFQQKYIFQRKRKSKSRTKYNVEVKNQLTENLDEIYSFHEEGHQELLPYSSSGADIVTHSNIPIPPEVKRISVNKDTGETLLHRAARTGNEEVALYCLATGTVEVNVRDNAGYTPLHECAVRGRVEIAKHLLKHGADVNCYSVDGIRPIHDAVENDKLEMVRILLSFGADPTLSTYAGKSLMKIARTDRMRKFLKVYVCDLNGHSPNAENPFWQFKQSCTHLEPEDKLGCAVFRDVPSDPEDEAVDLLTISPKPLFTTRRLTIEPGKRIEDYVLLQDILHSYRVSRSDFEALGLPSHLVKTVSVRGLQDSHSDSIYREMFNSIIDKEHISAVRLVDYAQVISKLEKHSTPSKRSKI